MGEGGGYSCTITYSSILSVVLLILFISSFKLAVEWAACQWSGWTYCPLTPNSGPIKAVTGQTWLWNDPRLWDILYRSLSSHNCLPLISLIHPPYGPTCFYHSGSLWRPAYVLNIHTTYKDQWKHCISSSLWFASDVLVVVFQVTAWFIVPACVELYEKITQSVMNISFYIAIQDDACGVIYIMCTEVFGLCSQHCWLPS